MSRSTSADSQLVGEAYSRVFQVRVAIERVIQATIIENIDHLDIKFYDNINNLEKFWTICLNSPRFATSIQVDDKKCFNNEFLKTHKLNKTIKIPDLVLRNYNKK